MAVAAVAACTWEGNGAALVIHGKWVEKSGEATPCVIVRERGTCRTPFLSELLRVIP